MCNYCDVSGCYLMIWIYPRLFYRIVVDILAGFTGSDPQFCNLPGRKWSKAI